jgi:hypothetical protein
MNVLGQCLCHKIQFEVEIEEQAVFNCHCSRCRVSHGAAFATQVLANANSLNFITGKEFLQEYRGAQAIRAFCRHCGSRLMNYSPDGTSYLSIAVSALVEQEHLSPIGECYVLEKLNFTQLNEAIPHFKQLPPIQ